jgi:hypothetical protein
MGIKWNSYEKKYLINHQQPRLNGNWFKDKISIKSKLKQRLKYHSNSWKENKESFPRLC